MPHEFALPYEAPISLDSGRLIGAQPRRLTLWTLLAGAICMVLGVCALVFEDPYWIMPVALVVIVCLHFGRLIAHRPPEYWYMRKFAYARMPRRLENDTVPTLTPDLPRGVVEVVGTVNLRMRDEDTLGSMIKKLHAFYVQLRFPIQVVVRAWPVAGGSVKRRWFVAVTADSDDVLQTRLGDVVASLKRAGLVGEAKNGDMYDSLQACWSSRTREGARLGPQTIDRPDRTHVIVDDEEHVRGLLLARTPSTVEANALKDVLDGELPVDMSMWLDPQDNADEKAQLMDKHNELETAQALNVGDAARGTYGRLGYRDPDLDEEIADVKRTRRALGKGLRVFVCTIAFVVRGRTEAEMRLRERLLIDQLREQIGGDPVLPMDYEQHHAPMMVVPTGEAPVTFPLRIVSPALARLYAFSNSSFDMPGGVDCGVSIDSHRANRLDPFGLPSPHMVLAGITGGGKGYWLKVFLWRFLHAFPDRRVWIIQAEKDEYGALVDAMESRGGRWPETQPVYVSEAPEPTVLVDAQPEQSWRVLSGRYLRIENPADLEQVVWEGVGAARRLRGGQLTVYDLTHMEGEQARGECIARLLAAIEYEAAHEPKATLGLVGVDELGIILRNAKAAAAVDTAYRRFRSIPHADDPKVISRRGMVGLTQMPRDLLRHGNGEKIIGLSEVQLYLRTMPAELRTVRNELHLSSDEVDFLENADDGEGLLLAGHARVGLKLQATPFEHEFAKT